MSGNKEVKEDDDFIDETEDDDDDDDDDDEDEDEFIPGADDDDVVESDSDNEDDAIVPLIDGILSLDQSQKLHYRGDCFHLVSTESVQWNLLDGTKRPLTSIYEFQMEGDCDIGSNQNNCCRSDSIISGLEENQKLNCKKFHVTWSVQSPEDVVLHNDNKRGTNGKAKLKRGDDDDDYVDQKLPAFVCHVYMKEIHTTESKETSVVELNGACNPILDDSNSVNLACRVVFSPISNNSSVAMSPNRATAASASKRRRHDSDDDDYNSNDEVDYDELIALHEDAGLPVATIQKRYRGDAGGGATQKNIFKSIPDEDDDDDIGF
jgi:hypothetical protein